MYLSMVSLENFMLFWVTQYTNLIAQNTRGRGIGRGDTRDASVTRRGRSVDAGVVALVCWICYEEQHQQRGCTNCCCMFCWQSGYIRTCYRFLLAKRMHQVMLKVELAKVHPQQYSTAKPNESALSLLRRNEYKL
jgi:hypothetical protein